MTVQNLYTQYLEGKITESKFLYEVRRDQNLDMISPTNSFADVVKILKNKSIISEKAHKESTGKLGAEVVAKTIDMVNPYEYSKGINYELEIMDIPATEGDLSNDNVLKAHKKVLANLTKNPQYYCDKMHGKGEVSDEWVEVTKKEIDKIGKGKTKIIREEYSAVLDLPNGKYFAIDDDWEDEYQGKNGLFFTIKGNNLYDIDGESIQSSPREFLSQFKPEEILKVEESINEHGQYADRVADVNADSSPLKETSKPTAEQIAIYEKYAAATGIPVENLMSMVREAKSKMKEAATYAGKDAVDDLKKDPKYGTLSSTAKSDVENKLKKGETVTIG
jgi:hypothetical protein